jgi:hypothetical protein
MPTIDALSAAAAVADTDELPVSQNGVAAKATRSQIVAGLQPALALSGGQLLGRNSVGSGPPEAIGVGANLTLSGGVLSGTAAPLILGMLPPGSAPGTADLVPVGQAGNTVAIPYGSFMGGLGALSGIDLSAMQALASGGNNVRRLADMFADAVPVEAFGARGDGVSDDSAALAAAVASGHPVRLGPKTYVVNGQWTISQAGTVLLGIPGASTLRRSQQSGNGAWIAVQADRFRAIGVIFDANRMAVSTESWGVLVTPVCQTSEFQDCAFRNAAGSTLGSGLVYQASFPAVCDHVVQDCEFSGNAVHGLWVQACSGVQVTGCRAFGNGQYGITADFNDSSFAQKVTLVQIQANRAWNNLRGIAVGNYNATNTQPAVWGNANPDAIAVLVAGNICHDNSLYGIAVSGEALTVTGNLLSNNGVGMAGGGGILANMSYSRVAGNMVTGTATYGIDAGGSLASCVNGNMISAALLGINCGGGTAMLVDGNVLQGCTQWGIVANNVESDGLGNNFGVACSNLAITGNWIGLVNAAAGGVLLRDGPQDVVVARNNFVGPGTLGNCLWANTDSVITEGNRFNFTARFVCNPVTSDGLQQIVFPDIAESVMVTAAPGGVQSMISAYQAQCVGQVSFVRITAGGAGYSHATLAIGGTGSGAAATAVISNGVVVGAVVSSVGSGYGPVGTTLPVVVSGDGTGCTAIAYAAPPLAEERRLTVQCNASVHFSRSGSVPLQENWTLTDIDVPANSEVTWHATWGSWRAGPFAAADYLAADGAGGAILRSQAGSDVALHPNAGGHVRLLTDTESTGCIMSVGRGSPEGVVTAPVGSDYRNLDGGVGATYWVKQTGTASIGWVAVV